MKKDYTAKSPTARTPSGVLKLYSTPLTPSYSDSMIFKTEAARESWHNDQYAATASAVTFKNMRPFRAGEEIVVNGDYEKIQKNNYFSYSGDTMIWYGFINGVTYVSENACKISYVIDVIQTFMFDAIIDENGKSKLPECFVERETVASDKYFEHIVEEGIGIQTKIIKQRDSLFAKLNGKNFDSLEQKSSSYAKIYLMCGKEKFTNSGQITYYALDRNKYNAYNFNSLYFATVPAEYLYIVLEQLPVGTSDSYPLSNLVGVYPIPTELIAENSEDARHFELKDATTPLTYALTIPKITAYTPKNNKLFTSEFCSVKVLNTQNGEKEINTNKLFHNSNSLSKTLYCYVNPIAIGGGVLISTQKIEQWVNQTANTETPDILIFSNQLPSLTIISDSYDEWQRTRESALNTSLTCSAISSTMSMLVGAASVASGNPLGISGVVAGGTNLMSSIENAKTERAVAFSSPDNIIASSSSLTDAYNLSYPVFVYSQPALDEVKKIDSYFNTYGYKVNEIKTPALFNRKKWDFIKTSNCHAVGTCSHLYLDKINQIFNAGIRLHHNSFNTITDCTVTNATA